MVAIELSKEQKQLFRDYEKLLQQNMDKALAGESIDKDEMNALSVGIRVVCQMHNLEFGRVW